jgi:hypothetical protein
MSKFEWWHINQKTHLEILEIFHRESERRPWCRFFLDDPPLSPGNLNSKCRIGFVPFDHCVQNRYYYVDKSRVLEVLAAGGITTQIDWDSSPENLPEGWQGAVRKSYFDYKNRKNTPNTMVALLAFTTGRFRGQGLSGMMLSKMIESAQSLGYRYLIIPALPPSQFEKNKVSLKMKEVAELKRDSGEYYDYWVRLHVRKGAEIVGHCDYSHRFVLNLKDFSKNVSLTPIHTTGEHLVRMDQDKVLGSKGKDMWQLVYADIERNIVTFNWGCVWVKYDLAKDNL